jgi:hypothetical protein
MPQSHGDGGLELLFSKKRGMCVSQCNTCGAPNRNERRFCSQCGASLGWVCECCTFFNFNDELFCGGCNSPAKSKIEASARAPVTTATPAATTPPSKRSVLISQEMKNVQKEIVIPKKDIAEGPQTVSQSEIDQLFKK